MIKVAIIDDQSLMREGLKTILSSYDDISIIALGKDGKEAVDIALKYSIDVMLLDIRMPILNGVDAVKEIKRHNNKIKIIMLTTFDDDEYILDAIGNGASGYLFKDIEYDKLAQNIKDVNNGQFIMPPKVAQVIVQKLKNQEKNKDELKQYNLTARELEIAELLKDGFTNKQIARAICISEGTVKNYISSIYNKVDINDRKELSLYLKEIL